MYEIVVIIGSLIVVITLIRSRLIYDKCHPILSRKERNSEPYHYKSFKQGTTRAQDCGKTSKKS